MSERRYIYTYIPDTGNPFHRDRRDQERRQHSGLTRILFIDLAEVWLRLRT